MERRARAAWRTGQRYQQAASLLTLTGALAGALAVLLAVSSAGEIVSYRDRGILVPAGLAAWAGELGMRLLVWGVWRTHWRCGPSGGPDAGVSTVQHAKQPPWFVSSWLPTRLFPSWAGQNV
jgi:hypothetical protein